MANMHLVTGYAGQEHVTSADHGVFHSYLFGADQFVFDRGNKLAANVESNNLIRVLDGDIYIQGRHVRLNEGTYVDLAIENGVQGVQRHDLIVARYTKDSMTAVEEVNLVVIKGTNANDPAYTTGDILNEGALLHDMPLYRVPLDGLNVGELVPLFTVKEGKTIQDKQDRTNDLTEETALADGDAIPFFDSSANGHRKTLLSSLKTFLANAFAAKVHNHAATDITSGILAAARGGTGVSSLAELASAMGAARVATGSYKGAGTSGESSPNKLTFPFVPKLVVIKSSRYDPHYMSFYVAGSSTMGGFTIKASGTTGSIGSFYNIASLSGATLSWYDEYNSQYCQMNKSEDTYYYVAIG